MRKVVGMGNALTDIVINVASDEVLERFGLARGGMTLVDEASQKKISEALHELPAVRSLGGSAGNTIRALAKLGTQTGFIGKVGHDATGDFLVSALGELEVEPFVLRGVADSGRCLSLVSADGERTMVTFLGAALELRADEISEDMFSCYDCLYLEGYLVQNHELISAAARVARAAGLRVALDLASFNVVESNLDFLRVLVRDDIDILFANEDEARIFTGLEDPHAALQTIAQMVDTAIVKLGSQGALIQRGEEFVRVGIVESAARVDTTGAGDFYAAGFLHGLCSGLSLQQSGTIGAITAGAVIAIPGTTLSPEAWRTIDAQTALVQKGEYLL